MKNNYPDPDSIDTQNVVSSTECTGMVSSIPDDDELDSLQEIYHIPNPKKE